MSVHSGSLRSQIVVQLIVAEPCAHKISWLFTQDEEIRLQ